MFNPIIPRDKYMQIVQIKMKVASRLIRIYTVCLSVTFF